MLRGAPFLWGLIFQVGTGGQRALDRPDVLFDGLPHIFRDFCMGFECFRRCFGPRGPSVHVGGPSARRGPKTPRGQRPVTINCLSLSKVIGTSMRYHRLIDTSMQGRV